MAIIQKPKKINYEKLPSIKVNEDVYLDAVEYLNWHDDLADSDWDILVEQALAFTFSKDAEFKKHLKQKSKSKNTVQNINNDGVNTHGE